MVIRAWERLARLESERQRIIQESQQRYGDYAWFLPDAEAEPDELEVEQKQEADEWQAANQ